MYEIKDPYCIQFDIDNLFKEIDQTEFVYTNKEQLREIFSNIYTGLQLLDQEDDLRFNMTKEDLISMHNYIDGRYLDMFDLEEKFMDIKEAL